MNKLVNCVICGKSMRPLNLPGNPEVSHGACAMEAAYKARGADPATSPYYQNLCKVRERQDAEVNCEG